MVGHLGILRKRGRKRRAEENGQRAQRSDRGPSTGLTASNALHHNVRATEPIGPRRTVPPFHQGERRDRALLKQKPENHQPIDVRTTTSNRLSH